MLRFHKPPEPKEHKCDAVDLATNPARPCTRSAQYTHGGHNCCWIHKQTARHPERGGNLMWVSELFGIERRLVLGEFFGDSRKKASP